MNGQRLWGLGFSFLVVVCLAWGQSPHPCEEPRPAVPDKTSGNETAVRLERQEWEALKAKDSATYERLLAEDFVSVGSDGVTTKNLGVKLTLWRCATRDSTIPLVHGPTARFPASSVWSNL